MIEVLFGDSEAGSMKVAKHYRKPIFEEDGSTAWFGKTPSEEEKERFMETFDGEPIEGTSKEVAAISFMLDIGDIQKPIESEYRKQLIYDMYVMDGMDDLEMVAELKQMGDKYLKELDRLKNYVLSGESLRIWYSNAPYSICGFYHLCSVLKEYSCNISVIKLPEYIKIKNNQIVSSISWGEIMPGKFYQFLSLEKKLSDIEIWYFSNKWDELKEENSPIRAVINGRVMGVPEDFYDGIIRREMPEEEIKIAQLIANLLGKYSIGVSDWWYAQRIERMIERGELFVVKDSDMRYGKIIKKK